MNWLPVDPAWDSRLESVREVSDPAVAWKELVSLSKYDLDFLKCAKLDRAVEKLAIAEPPSAELERIRLAFLGSSTLEHLVPGIRIAGLRRGLWIEIFVGGYGLYLQELLDSNSRLHAFEPNVVCLALDADHLLSIAEGNIEFTLERLRTCWGLVRQTFSAMVIQQTALPVVPDLFGNNESRMKDSPQILLRNLNRAMEQEAELGGVNLLAIDKYSAIDGLNAWHDPALWLRARQEVHPRVSPLYGEYAARLMAAHRGRSAKCLVLDLDNTLWGGVISEDGREGITLGEGSAAGEAFVNFQRYVLRLKERGIILAVCSKNDESIALQPFTEHVDMVLKRNDIACFIANWRDKASNLRHIAEMLNIGTDSLVFVDDSPFERNLVRQELPEVSVPEMPEDPALYVQCLAGAGYFEGVVLTEEDRRRTEKYGANAERESMRQSSTDMQSYLRGMQMELSCKPFDLFGLQRIFQLINKTNQFNLTTRRYSEEEVRALLGNPKARTWQIRLGDRFGDSGMIAVLIGLLNEQGDMVMDTWLMSCRALGRQVEEASLNLVIEEARLIGVKKVIGYYKPTAKNTMVSDHYARMGFSHLETDSTGNSRWHLDVKTYKQRETHIRILEDARATI